jgi:hypothetical protein
MVVAEALDFPGAVTQGFDLPDASLMIAWCRYRFTQGLLRSETARAAGPPPAGRGALSGWQSKVNAARPGRIYRSRTVRDRKCSLNIQRQLPKASVIEPAKLYS